VTESQKRRPAENGDLGIDAKGFEERAISPLKELGAYEVLWEDRRTTFKTLSEKFAKHPGAVPSEFVPEKRALTYGRFVLEHFHKAGVHRFGVRVHGAGEYPERLRDAQHPVELLYYQGWWDLVESRSVAVVGTRRPTPVGIARAKRLVKALVKDGFTIVSGLAAGIDTVAHQTAIDEGGRTIAVLGTPLSRVYPRSNVALQRLIADEFLVISQVPLKRYVRQLYTQNRWFFPERNITMSALTEGTIIVEAGETSGTLIQARAALDQGRKLFILDSVFRNERLTWPHEFEEQGAIRVADYDDITRYLPSPTVHTDRRPH
jgi:DNA processing protein